MESSIEERSEVIDSPVVGVVINCLWLYLFEEPNSYTRMVGSVPCLTEVRVDEKESVGNYYKICSDSGVQGFCFKDFILLKQKEIEHG